jgi:SAM-dependent methyltransferase
MPPCAERDTGNSDNDIKGQLLANGIGEMRDGLPDDIRRVDFKGKTVVDLGCNFGYYSFIVRKAGARRVLGIDSDARVIRGCEIIKAINALDRVAFQNLDIINAKNIGPFDIGMMIDLIGKGMVQNGIAKHLLNSLEQLSEKEMLLTVRPRYHIKKNLQNDFAGLKEKYPGNYIQNTYFHMLDYVRDRFESDWEMHPISPPNDPMAEAKQTLHFIKKGR